MHKPLPLKTALKTPLLAAAVALLAGCNLNDSADSETPATVAAVPQVPVLDAWRTDLSGRYARVLETTTSFPVTTWPAAGITDTSGASGLNTYSDVQLVRESAGDVYISASGLSSHQMGPWYWNVSNIFGNWPRNTAIVYRFPKTPVELADDKRVTLGLGAQGMWVNGVPLFNQLDGAQYTTSAGMETRPGGADFGANPSSFWIRDAIPVEGPTFDASNAHQPPNGSYHYHSNPLALRFQLGDNVKFDAASAKYSEDVSKLHHSPILGFARDGYPIYGPYGYSNCSGTGSGVTRMRAGFVIRDGNNGTTNLNTEGRKSIGKWVAQHHAYTATANANGRITLSADQYGPNIGGYFYLGRYNEDWEYLGDMGKVQATDFDLDRHNGRTCVTPEYPQGTYAYHVAIDATGKATYPYTVGRQLRGNPSGGLLAATAVITDALTTYKSGLAYVTPTVSLAVDTPARRVLQWASAEGATYSVEASADNGLTWAVIATNVGGTSPGADSAPGGSGYYALTPLMASYTDSRSLSTTPKYRLSAPTLRAHQTTAVAATKAQVESVLPASVTRGSTVRLAIKLTGNQPIADFDPVASIVPLAVELVSLDGSTVIASGSNIVRQVNITQADITIPSTAAAGSYMVRIRFPGTNVLTAAFQSVNQTAGVAAAAIRADLSYADRPLVVN